MRDSTPARSPLAQPTWRGALLRLGVILSLVGLSPRESLGSARPRYGGELVVPCSAAPRPVDPISVRTPEEIELALALFDTLYVFGPGGVRPNLVEGEPQISADGKTWRIKLLPDLYFHNDDPVTAEDVAASLRRLLGPGASEHAWLLADIAGAKEYRSKKAKTVSGISAPSERELELTFTVAPDPADLKARLAAPPTAVVKPQGGSLLGSGPFYRDPRDRSKTEMRLLPFAKHAQGRPYLERLIFRQYAILDEQTSFLTRDLWITFHEPAPPPKGPPPAARRLVGPEVLTEALLMRDAKSYAGSAPFRAALDVAIERKNILENALTGLLDAGEPAARLLPAGLSPRTKRPAVYDEAAARKGFAAASALYAPPAELEIIYDQSQTGHGALADQLREYLYTADAPPARAVGLSGADFASKLAAGDFAVAVALIAPVAPRALGLPRALAAAGDQDAAFALVAKGGHLSRAAKKKEEELSASGKLCPISHRSPEALYDPRLKGLYYNAIGALDFSRAWIEE